MVPLGTSKSAAVIPAKTRQQMTGSTAMHSRPTKPRTTTRRSARVHGRCTTKAERSTTSGIVWASAMCALLLGAFGAEVATSQPAVAAVERLHGLVLDVESARHEVVIRQDETGTMPGLTMTFRLGNAAVRSLRAGDRIEANVEGSNAPATLSDVRV